MSPAVCGRRDCPETAPHFHFRGSADWVPVSSLEIPAWLHCALSVLHADMTPRETKACLDVVSAALFPLQPPAPPRDPCPLCKGTGATTRISFRDHTKQIEQQCRACRGAGVLPAAGAGDGDQGVEARVVELSVVVDGWPESLNAVEVPSDKFPPGCVVLVKRKEGA